MPQNVQPRDRVPFLSEKNVSPSEVSVVEEEAGMAGVRWAHGCQAGVGGDW